MTDVQLTTWLDETRAAAATPEHAWDRRAIDWPLSSNSVVVEVGGYKGRWALQIAEKYNAYLYVFEPQPWAAEVCRALLGDRATVLNYGLGVEDAALPMRAWETDGCSFVKGGDGPTGWMHEIGRAFEELGIARVDLMLVNIEGYEYTLLPHMFDRGIHPRRLMVQFHDYADPTGTHRRAIEQRIAGRYRLAWDYGTLTAWEAL